MKFSILLISFLLAATSASAAPFFADGHFSVEESVRYKLPKREKSGLKNLTSLDCRSRIETIVCLSEPAANDFEKRTCESGSISYAIYFEEIYDQFPAVMQKVFCSIDVIYIEKKLNSTAYASTGIDDSVVIGIRQSVIDEKLSLSQLFTWKEQLSFGGRGDSYETDPKLPNVTAHTDHEVNDLLYFILAHEFGHIIDFANDVNKQVSGCPEATKSNPEPECELADKTWGKISWYTNKQPWTDFKNRLGFCFYWCDGNSPDITTIPQVYADLIERSDFISSYATTQPWDDFADSLGVYLTYKNLGMSLVLDTKQGASYDIMAKLNSPIFAKKLAYIEDLLGRKDLKYPKSAK